MVQYILSRQLPEVRSQIRLYPGIFKVVIKVHYQVIMAVTGPFFMGNS